MSAGLVKLLQILERAAFLGALPGEDLEEREAKCVDVALDRRAFAGELLRRHVLRRSCELADGVSRDRGDAEVGDADVALAVDHHVGGLEVAVQDTAFVRGGHAGTELPRDLHGLVVRHAPDPSQQRAEVLAVHVLHRQETAAVGVTEVVQTAHVLVRDLARHPQLVVELAQPRVTRGHGLRQELQRHRLLEREILGAVHLAHPAAPKQGDHSIAAGNDGAGRECVRAWRDLRGTDRGGSGEAGIQRDLVVRCAHRAHSSLFGSARIGPWPQHFFVSSERSSSLR